MLWYNIVKIKNFYESPLGMSVAGAINMAIDKLWGDSQHENIIAIGYAFPYINQYISSGNDNNISIIIPPETGVMHWPEVNMNKVVLASEYELPVKSNNVNRVIAIHSLEYTEQARRMLSDIHRILTPSGRAIIVVPHRLGMWSKNANTPFGSGQPFSCQQLYQLMTESQLIPIRHTQALYFPPYNNKLINGCSLFWEKYMPLFGGVLVIEVEKQIYSTIGNARKVQTREIYLPPLTTPSMPKDSL